MIQKDYKIVRTWEDVQELKYELDQVGYVAFDTETTGLNTRKDKVIGYSICTRPGKSFYYPRYIWDKNTQQLVSAPFLDGSLGDESVLGKLSKKELLTWNGSFDVRMMKSNYGIDLTKNIIADGMLLRHTVNEEGPFALKTVGIELQHEIGLDVEEVANKEQIELKENVKKNGGTTTKNNYEMYKADLDVMGMYAASDADLTYRICEHYLGVLEKEGLSKLFFDDEVMPLYREVTIPMEMKGVKLDLPLINKLNEDIQKDIKFLEEEVLNNLYAIPQTETYIQDKLDKEVPIKNSGSFLQAYIKYFSYLECPKSEKTGKFLVGKMDIPHEHAGFIKEGLTQGLEAPLKIIQRILYNEKNGNLINIFSKKQMSDLAFNYLGYEPLSETEKGSPQFNEEFVEHLVGQGVAWASLLNDYNKLTKIKGSYIDRFLEGQEDGRYYFSYKQHGTISGRYGSDAQQLPRPIEPGEASNIVIKYNNEIRRFFIAENDRVFIDCDYESLEPHVFAHVSGDKGLQDIFIKGHDFYSTIAIATEGLHEYSADKKAENYLGKKAKSKRQLAKAYALGVPYGMGGYALGKNLNIPTEEAELLVESYLGAYPELAKWMDWSKEQAISEGYVRSELGRIRHLPKVKRVYDKFGDKILDFKYRNKLSNKIPREYIQMMYMDYKNGVNNSRNFQIQSMSASIVNRAAIEVTRRFEKAGIAGHVCAQIHDQLIFNVPKDKSEVAAKIVQDTMENIVKLSVKLKAPPSVSLNWKDGH
jgi:DNA polymerase I-like protein with 3'-5' exonuclease and polymerase domains